MKQLVIACCLLTVAGCVVDDGQGPADGAVPDSGIEPEDTETETGETDDGVDPPVCPPITESFCAHTPGWHKPVAQRVPASIAGEGAAFKLGTWAEGDTLGDDYGYYFAVIGERPGADGPEQFFLVAGLIDPFDDQDLFEFSVTPLSNENEARFVDLVYGPGFYVWTAVLCDAQNCFLAQSSATPQAPDDFTPLPGGTLPAGLVPNALEVVGDDIYAVGDGIAKMEPWGWRIEVEPGSGPVFNGVSSDDYFDQEFMVVAVGDRGRLVTIIADETVEVQTGIAEDLLDVFLMSFSFKSDQPRYWFWAVGRSGRILIGNSAGLAECAVSNEDLVQIGYFPDLNWEGVILYHAVIAKSGRVFHSPNPFSDELCQLPPGPADPIRFDFFTCIDGANPTYIVPDGIYGGEYVECVYTD